MKIRTHFYYYNKGKHFVYGGTMVMQNRQLISLGELPVEPEGRPFYYDDTYHTFTYEHQDKKASLDANRIITESSYKTTQLEYLVKLNWIQQQKLLWMFRRHWMQQPGNMVHLVILGIIVTLAFMSFELIQSRY
ncbi:MAG: hypothetical protein ABI772_11630 [Bacteroidota bacterium]